MKTFPDPTLERLILERIKFEYATEMPPYVITNLTVEQIVDFETRAVRTFFRTFLPGREVRKETVKSVIVYASWWQQFKKTYFPEILKRLFPVMFHEEPVVIRHHHLCPHTGAEPDDKEMCFNFLKGLEPAEWMTAFTLLAGDDQLGKEGE
jgi:hypothetical protein